MTKKAFHLKLSFRLVFVVVRTKSPREKDCMCKPIAGNLVRPKEDCIVMPLVGSSEGLAGEAIPLSKNVEGIAEGPDPKFPDYFFILFEHGSMGSMLVRMHHTAIKGVERSASRF